MAGLPSPSTTNLGAQLFDKGCRQGTLLNVPARTIWLGRGQDGHWSIEETTINDASLIVVSQNCDIYASPKTEPRVEAIVARTTTDSNEIHTARKGNSARLFLVKESDGKSLVADARHRVPLDKQSLLDVNFSSPFTDDKAIERFARWVAGRYNRPALDNALVEAIQKPIVDAVSALTRTGGAVLGVLERVDELRFSVAEDKPPWTVHLIAMLDEVSVLTAEEEAELGGWLEEALSVGENNVKEIAFATRYDKTISLHDYLRTTKLQLDHFSLDER
jgi:hypothetical protein